MARGAAGPLPAIVGVAATGESAGGRSFDGKTEVAIFPGDLPDDSSDLFNPSSELFRGRSSGGPEDADYRFVRFRPPELEDAGDGVPALPHIRLDRTLQFLIGDRLR
jgi:predicted YcjX-like family ATPase